MDDVTLEEAYRKWADDLARYATALVGPSDAVDVVADAVTSVIASDRWSEVREPERYLMRAVLNSSRQRARSGQRRRAREAKAALLDETIVREPEVVSQLRMDVLSTQQRAAIHLTYWGDMKPAAVAREMGISEGTVRRHLARARSKLRKVMSDDDR